MATCAGISIMQARMTRPQGMLWGMLAEIATAPDSRGRRLLHVTALYETVGHHGLVYVTTRPSPFWYSMVVPSLLDRLARASMISLL